MDHRSILYETTMAEAIKKICCKCFKGKKDKVDEGNAYGGGFSDGDDNDDWGNEGWDDVESGKSSNSMTSRGDSSPLLVGRKTVASSNSSQQQAAGQPYRSSSASNKSSRRNTKTRTRGIYSLSKGNSIKSDKAKVVVRQNKLVHKKAEDIFGSLGMDRKEMSKQTKMRVSKPSAMQNVKNISSRFQEEDEDDAEEEVGEGWDE